MTGRPVEDEAGFSRWVCDVAAWHGWDMQFHTPDSRMVRAGWPDLVLIRAPRVIFAELKSPTGKLYREQAQALLALQRCGLETAVWRPLDRDRIQAVLARGSAARAYADIPDPAMLPPRSKRRPAGLPAGARRQAGW
jgi:hypothetical protein